MAKIIDYRIVISAHATENELRAASFLRDNVKLVVGKKLPIVRDAEPPVPYEIVVGETTREALDSFTVTRARDPLAGASWEYIMKSVGTRFYLTGLGIPPEAEAPYTSAYRLLDDGKIGTVMAAYHFVEDILGYDFLYAAYEDFPENPDLSIPEDYDYAYTKEAFRREQPKLFDGAAFYTLPCAEELHWNMGCMIFKTRSGRIVVIDGGHEGETDRFLSILRTITGEEVPHVSAWLFSHMHRDHYGVYYTLCTDERYRGKITVDGFYGNLLTEEFYTTLAKEKSAKFAEVRRVILDSGKVTGATVHTVNAGDVIEIDEIRFDVIHVPDIAYADKMNMNDSSTVYKMTYDGGQTMMLLGDAEWVSSNDLVENRSDLLKSDIVQVGHHGCGNVSGKCYELIDADAYIWQIGEKFWYSDGGEGLNTHNTGVIRTRAYMMRKPPKKENIHVVMDHILSSPLPMEIL